MNIVVLDGYTLNPGDLDWSVVRALGDCVIHDRSSPNEVLSRAGNAEIVLTNKTVLDANVIRALPDLKYIGVLATGTNVVDLAAARERGIPVTNVPDYASESVAQHTFALLLELASRAGFHGELVAQGGWSDQPDFSFWKRPLVELAGLKLGIIGYGGIGRAVARIALGFNMSVCAAVNRPRSSPDGIRFTDIDAIFRDSDVVSLHCPLTPETTRLVNAQRLASMKSGAFLINTSRGGLIDELALADALNRGHLGGAGLDVLSVEPPPRDHPLFRAKNCIITPHIGWATRASRERLMCAAAANIQAFLNGTPTNVVNV